MRTKEARFAATLDMISDGYCACCGSDGVQVHTIDGPAATWTTWSCNKCGYQLREHIRKEEEGKT
jgi:rubrerythrin